MSRWLLGLASMSRSLRPPGRKQANALDRPLGISIDETGSFEWNKELYSKLENLSKKNAPSGPGR